MTTSLVQGVGGPLILQVFEFSGGPLVDLSTTPTITITSLSDGTVAVGPTTTGVTHPALGTYLYNWSAPVSAGLYQVLWNGTLAPSGTYQGVELVTVYLPANTTVGPCAGWDLDYGCDPNWDTYSPSLQAAATSYASTVLWAATGRRFGLCTRTIRPCGMDCTGGNLGGWGWGGGYYWSEGTWLPYIGFDGLWRNCWCGCNGTPGCCQCQVDCQVYLPGPAAAVLSVTVDGEVIDPATYRIDNGIWLVRTRETSDEANPPCWPEFQDYNVDSGNHTFIITYQQGLPVPAPLQRAGGELASEYAKACLGLPCRLPSRTTSIARQGVTISLTDVNVLLEKGLTGVATVDQLIRTYNPSGLVSALRVSSPDTERIRETTWFGV